MNEVKKNILEISLVKISRGFITLSLCERFSDIQFCNLSFMCLSMLMGLKQKTASLTFVHLVTSLIYLSHMILRTVFQFK